MDKDNKIIIITGPTATGKTSLAVNLAKEFNGEIISADSRQVYKFMDLGTGKDLDEYENVPYHLINVAHPNEIFSLYDFLERTKVAIQDIFSRGKLPIICGGTPLYINAILNKFELSNIEFDPKLRENLDAMSLEELTLMLKELSIEHYNQLNDDDKINKIRVRRQIEIAKLPKHNKAKSWPNFRPLTLGVYYPREVVRERVDIRLKARFALGMIDEVKFIHEHENVSFEKLESFGLEYREISKYLKAECSYEELYSNLLNKIRQFVKRQDIYFRKIEREGSKINWINSGNLEEAKKLIQEFL